MAWEDLKEDIDECLRSYRPLFKRHVKRLPDRWEGTYWDDWTDYLDGPTEEYVGDDIQARDAEVIAEDAEKRAVQVAALFPEEYNRFQAWLAEVGHPDLYAEFEGQLRKEHAAGLYPGVPVSQVPK